MRRIKWNKKLFISGCILICVFALLSGCNMAEKRNGDEQGPSQVISEINVWSAAQNENHIYHVRYPYYYYFFEPSSGGGVKSSLGDLENIQYSSDLTEEEFDYFVNYLTNLPKQEASEDSTLAYQVYFHYYDENGEEHSGYSKGYDTFPPGWDEFITRYNEICGGDYLAVNEEVQRVTPEFLTEVFDVTDEDVRDGTLQDVIDVQKLDIVRIEKVK